MDKNSSIVIIDYNIGNLSSIQNMFKKIGVKAHISSDTEIIGNASKLILPGVGSFDYGISSLKSSSFYKVLEAKVLNKGTPILGVCLGAQLLTESSEEGTFPGLGWIKGKVVGFNTTIMKEKKLKVPHMGWTSVTSKRESMLFTGMHPDPRFYFVHSYHLECANQEDEILTANYGYEFPAAIERSNIIGVQFHPEKSHKYGMKLYENFVNLY